MLVASHASKSVAIRSWLLFDPTPDVKGELLLLSWDDGEAYSRRTLMTPSDSAGKLPPPPSASPPRVSNYAAPARRLIAWLIDFFLFSFFAVVLTSAAIWSTNQSDDCQGGDAEPCSYGQVAALLLVPLACFFILSPLYSVALLRIRGRTLGMQVAGIRAETDGQPPPRWVWRWVVGYMPLLIPFVGFILVLAFRLPIFWDARRQGVNDRAARTVVVSGRSATAIRTS